jgi:uncharacterized membrane protein
LIINKNPCMNKTLLVCFFILLGITVFFQSCKHEPTLTLNQDDLTKEDTTTANCDPDTVYFDNDILPLIVSSCAYSGCHDAATQQNEVVLDNYTNIKNTGEITPGDPNESKLYKVIVTLDSNKVMPPPPKSKLTSDQIALINKWITQGAKNNKCNECDTTNVKYSEQVTSVLNNCISCHNASNSSGNVLLDTYANVKIQVDNGKLKGSIEQTAGFSPMPQGGKLSDCNILIINTWINEGALNN